MKVNKTVTFFSHNCNIKHKYFEYKDILRLLKSADGGKFLIKWQGGQACAQTP